MLLSTHNLFTRTNMKLGGVNRNRNQSIISLTPTTASSPHSIFVFELNQEIGMPVAILIRLIDELTNYWEQTAELLWERLVWLTQSSLMKAAIERLAGGRYFLPLFSTNLTTTLTGCTYLWYVSCRKWYQLCVENLVFIFNFSCFPDAALLCFASLSYFYSWERRYHISKTKNTPRKMNTTSSKQHILFQKKEKNPFLFMWSDTTTQHNNSVCCVCFVG